MIETNQLSSGVTTQSPPVLWLPDPKVTTIHGKRSDKGRNAAVNRDFQASLVRIAKSPTTAWHDFAQLCEAAGL